MFDDDGTVTGARVGMGEIAVDMEARDFESAGRTWKYHAAHAGNPHAVGAAVTVVYAGATQQTAEVYAGSGYLSQSAPTLFFGRGDAMEIRVRWPGGGTTVHPVDPYTAQVTLHR